MTAPRTISATPQPVRLYVEDAGILEGMAREVLFLGRAAVEIATFSGQVSTFAAAVVEGCDWLTDEDVRSLRASVNGDAERAKTHDARMTIEGILAQHGPMSRERVRQLFLAEQDSGFRDAWAALLAAEEIEERGKDEHGAPLYRLALLF